MSFSRSIRFPKYKKDVIPGPGSYEVDWGGIGSNSPKFTIHNTPRFPEVCKNKVREPREFKKCTISNMRTTLVSSKTSVLCPSVQNVTFRKSLRTASTLRDLLIFRNNSATVNGRSIHTYEEKNYEKDDEIDDKCSEAGYQASVEESEINSKYSESSITDDSGYSNSLPSTSEINCNKQRVLSKSKIATESEPRSKKCRKLRRKGRIINNRFDTSNSESYENERFTVVESRIQTKSQPRLRWKIPAENHDFQFKLGHF